MIRAILLLLSLLLASPAALAAPCHAPERPAASAHHAHHEAPAAPEPTAHDCIGCIPPESWRGAPLATNAAPTARMTSRFVARAPTGWASRPTPPPPRG